MPARGPRRAPSQSALSKQRVVAEAIRIADREGVDGLTMRRLAGDLGAGAMSLYHYLASKEALLDAMIGVVFDEIELPPAEDADWRSAMRRWSRSARQALARHRWAITLMESRTTPGSANLRHREAVTACLRRAGFSVAMATHANWLLNSLVYGYALQEVGLPFDTEGELADVSLPQPPADEFPYLDESATTRASTDDDPTQEFAFGLELVLAALEPLRGSR